MVNLKSLKAWVEAKTTVEQSYIKVMFTILAILSLSISLKLDTVLLSFSEPVTIWPFIVLHVLIVIFIAILSFKTVNTYSLLFSIPISSVLLFCASLMVGRIWDTLFIFAGIISYCALRICFNKDKKYFFCLILSLIIFLVGFSVHQYLFKYALNNQFMDKKITYNEVINTLLSTNNKYICVVHRVKCLEFDSKGKMPEKEEIAGIGSHLIETAISSRNGLFYYASRTNVNFPDSPKFTSNLNYAVYYDHRRDKGLIIYDDVSGRYTFTMNTHKFNFIIIIFIMVWVSGGLYAYRLHR